MTQKLVNLVRQILEEKVGVAIKGLNGEGAPCPDGFSVFFSSEFWETVKTKVIAPREKFQGGNYGIERIISWHLFLLPKCQGTVRVGDYWYIWLSNCIYLIIAKVLANRLRKVIGDLVQSIPINIHFRKTIGRQRPSGRGDPGSMIEKGVQGIHVEC